MSTEVVPPSRIEEWRESLGSADSRTASPDRAVMRYFATALRPSLSRRGAWNARQSGHFAFTQCLLRSPGR